MTANDPRVIVALDYPDKASAMHFVSKVSPDLCRLKVGKGMFTYYGPDFVRELTALGFTVFLDLKFHDIPNTVFDACTAAAKLGVWMVNVHISGGIEMMRAARRAIDIPSSKNKPLLIGVTILTSLDQDDLSSLGIDDSLEDTVLRLARIAKTAGLDGVVCSAQEAVLLRKNLGDDFLLITPGIRLSSDDIADQKRVMTPGAAFAAGVDYLVMGRSITEARNPREILLSLQTRKIVTD
ncbi:MAG: orotidine-5'-phosphate decarboxylase [Coxiellaceae bacterium]|nr:orotidine-5'-phosphate decarboxylase [Coxiellaceae bacterium]